MGGNGRDTVSAVVARQRGRARVRAATVVLGAAGLVTAGAVAYTLPGATHTGTSTSATPASVSGGNGATAHATSGGSAATTSPAPGSGVQAPAPGSGAAHATSGGSG